MKKILSVAIALCLSFAMAIPAFAANPKDSADVPQGENGTRPSTGSATIQNDDEIGNGGNYYVNGDDAAYDLDDWNSTNGFGGTPLGSKAGANSDSQGDAEINVWAKVIETGSDFTIYNIDIEWGYMKFVYSDNGKEWDPITHTYIGDASGAAIPSWWIDNSMEAGKSGNADEWYLNGINNLISITNHSNGAVDAEFAYTMLKDAAYDQTASGNSNASWFNDDSTLGDSVVGGFYTKNTEALAGALVLTSPVGNNAYDTLSSNSNKVTLATAEGRMTTAAIDAELNSDLLENYNGSNGDQFTNYSEVFFAFSGKPDEGRGDVLPVFTKVGVITITIVPYTAVDVYNTIGSWTPPTPPTP